MKKSQSRHTKSAKNNKPKAAKIIEEEFQEKREIDEIVKNMRLLEEKLVEMRPEHFSRKDITYAILSSMLVCLTFVFKGGVVAIIQNMSPMHVMAAVILTGIILTLEIYYISYARVVDKNERKFGQFWAKRFFTLYAISILTSLILVYVFAMDNQLDSYLEILQAVLVLSFPSAVGAAIPSLLKKY